METDVPPLHPTPSASAKVRQWMGFMSTNGVKTQSFSGSSVGRVSAEKPGVGQEGTGGFFQPLLKMVVGLCHGWRPPVLLGAAQGGPHSAVPITHLGVCGSACPGLSRTSVQQQGRFESFFFFF